MKPLKKYFIKRRNLQSSELSLIRSYPKSLHKIGIISNSGFIPDTNFITKLKNGFGNTIQIFIFVLDRKFQSNEDFFRININDFNFFGAFRNESVIKNLKDLDLLIDLTSTRAIEKLFILNQSSKAFKVCVGAGFCDNCNLTLNLKTFDQNLFADEMIKYHNILKR